MKFKSVTYLNYFTLLFFLAVPNFKTSSFLQYKIEFGFSLPKASQITFQETVTPIMEGITNFHNTIMFSLIGIGVFVFCLLLHLSIFIIYRSRNYSNNIIFSIIFFILIILFLYFTANTNDVFVELNFNDNRRNDYHYLIGFDSFIELTVDDLQSDIPQLVEMGNIIYKIFPLTSYIFYSIDLNSYPSDLTIIKDKKEVIDTFFKIIKFFKKEEAIVFNSFPYYYPVFWSKLYFSPHVYVIYVIASTLGFNEASNIWEFYLGNSSNSKIFVTLLSLLNVILINNDDGDFNPQAPLTYLTFLILLGDMLYDSIDLNLYNKVYLLLLKLFGL